MSSSTSTHCSQLSDPSAFPAVLLPFHGGRDMTLLRVCVLGGGGQVFSVTLLPADSVSPVFKEKHGPKVFPSASPVPLCFTSASPSCVCVAVRGHPSSGGPGCPGRARGGFYSGVPLLYKDGELAAQ